MRPSERLVSQQGPSGVTFLHLRIWICTFVIVNSYVNSLDSSPSLSLWSCAPELFVLNYGST